MTIRAMSRYGYDARLEQLKNDIKSDAAKTARLNALLKAQSDAKAAQADAEAAYAKLDARSADLDERSSAVGEREAAVVAREAELHVTIDRAARAQAILDQMGANLRAADAAPAPSLGGLSGSGAGTATAGGTPSLTTG